LPKPPPASSLLIDIPTAALDNEIRELIVMKDFGFDELENGALRFGDMPGPALRDDDVQFRYAKRGARRCPIRCKPAR
jgi:hypothetical protein